MLVAHFLQARLWQAGRLAVATTEVYHSTSNSLPPLLSALPAGAAQGLESLRYHEGMSNPHPAGAITNPAAPQYADPARRFSTGLSGNPTRSFVA